MSTQLKLNLFRYLGTLAAILFIGFVVGAAIGIQIGITHMKGEAVRSGHAKYEDGRYFEWKHPIEYTREVFWEAFLKNERRRR